MQSIRSQIRDVFRFQNEIRAKHNELLAEKWRVEVVGAVVGISAVVSYCYVQYVWTYHDKLNYVSAIIFCVCTLWIAAALGTGAVAQTRNRPEQHCVHMNKALVRFHLSYDSRRQVLRPLTGSPSGPVTPFSDVVGSGRKSPLR